MKKKRIIAFVCALACMMSLVVSASAAVTRASDQIKSYRMDAIVTEGAINVEFSITGKYIMDKIGCQSIYVYKKVGTSWVYAMGRTEYNTGMSVTQRGHLGNTITLSGTAGVEYMVVVTVFAENSEGRDTRSDTFFVTGQ